MRTGDHTRCRKATGSAYASNLFVAVDQLTWDAGEEHVRRYELPEARYWSHCFCDVCGSSVPWLSRTGKAYIVPAGTLDEDPGIRAGRNIYWGSRAPWYLHASELETFDEGPPRR
ncbi:MAG: GFA family protein [Deltaproteobacteria bacterium]|nr:GFA family protein [Deltaproteobacteria bacterium]MBW2258107.1 GFA family protein [Deltaproteobacteria bacterium]